MSVGDGVFGGLVFLGLVWLYVVTRDRWRWRRIGAWLAGLVLTPLLALGAWSMGDHYLSARPKVETAFWDIPVGATADEVLFRKGEPQQREAEFWAYWDDRLGHVVGFKAGKVWSVEAIALQEAPGALPTLQGIGNYSDLDAVRQKFGEPDVVSTAKGGTRRRVSFSKWGVMFQMEKNKVVSVGVFDPALGPIRYPHEAAPAASAARKD